MNSSQVLNDSQCDLQESKKLTIPEWYRLKFGDNAVEYLVYGDWLPWDITKVNNWADVVETNIRLADQYKRIEANAIKMGWDKILTEPAFAEYVQTKANQTSRGAPFIDFLSLVKAIRNQ